MVQLQEVFGATTETFSDAIIFLPISLFFSHLQDAELERPLKRYGSSQSHSSADTSPASSNCSLSPQFPASCISLPLTSEDEKPTSSKQINNKTYTISSGASKYGESSTSFAASQRDSQTVYSSSSFKNVISSKSRTAPVEVVPSPADSTATNEASEASDLGAITDFDRVACSPANDYMFSPLEARKISEENVMLINKGEKTPHTLKKRPSNIICYK